MMNLYIEKVPNGILFNNDCLDVMDELIKQNVKVDAIITDPPYENDTHCGGKTEMAQRKLVKSNHIDFISEGRF